MAAKDYYKTLRVERDATDAEIKKAYRKLAMENHPDHNEGDKEAEERFKGISEAYAVLSDSTKRRNYDRFGAEGFGQRYSQEEIFQSFDFGSILDELGMGGQGGFDFRNIFSGGQGGASPFGRGGPRPAKGQDVKSPFTISFHESYMGGERSLPLSGPGGTETLSIKIPAGIKTGQKLRVRGKGRPGSGGGPHGDLFLEVLVSEHPIYSRHGDNVQIILEVPFTTLVLGGSAEVELPGGGSKRLKIPAATAPGQRLRIRGEGFPNKQKKGDALVRVEPRLPGEVSEEQQVHLEALRDLGL